MCARYYVDDEVIEAALELVRSSNPALRSLPSGDVYPSERAAVVAAHREHLHAGLMTWGFLHPGGKGLIINTRSERAWNSPLFRECMAKRRLVVPARAFYEWDQEKNKVTFTQEEQGPIYLAGIFDVTANGHRFSILTTEANVSVSPYHDRMPVLLRREDIDDWLFDESAARELLKIPMPALLAQRENDQLSFR